jgi:hypothetical protein
LVVIRSEERRERWISQEPHHAAAHGFAMNNHVGVEKENERGGGELGAEITRSRGTQRVIMPSHDGAHPCCERTRAVGRAIVDHDQLIIGPG